VHNPSYGGPVRERSNVVVRYPDDQGAPDETWLEGVAARYHGALSEQRMLSAPVQRIATFPAAWFAKAFVDDLTASGRWRARIE
jgi:hypothetical protein